MEKFDPSELFCITHKKRLIAIDLEGRTDKRLLCHHCLSDPNKGYKLSEVRGASTSCIDKIISFTAIEKRHEELVENNQEIVKILEKAVDFLDSIIVKVEQLKTDIASTTHKMMKSSAPENITILKDSLQKFSTEGKIWHGLELESYIGNYKELEKQILNGKRKEKIFRDLMEPTTREYDIIDQALRNLSILWRYDKSLFKYDTDLMVSGSYDKRIRVIDARDFELVSTMENCHDDGITAVQMMPNQSLCATSSTDRCVKLFSIFRKKLVKTIRLNEIDRLLTLKISADGRFIFTAAQQSIFLLSAKRGNMLYCYKRVHEDTIWKINCTMDSRYIITGSSDKKVKILGVRTKQVIHVYDQLHTKCIDGVAISNDSRLLITGSRDRSICFVDFISREKIQSVTFESLVYAVAISPNQKFVAAGCEDGSIKLVDARTRKLIHNFKKVHDKPISHLTFHTNNYQIISISWDKALKVTNINTLQLDHVINSIHLFDDRRYTINDLSIAT